MGLDSERELRGLAFGDTVWTDTQGANLFQLAHPELQIDNVLLLSGVERRVNNVPAQLAAYIKDKPVYCPTYLLFAFAFPG